MAELTDEGQYVTDLDEAVLSVAKAELNEDEKNRDGAIQTLREWIKQQPWLNTPTGSRYLLKYLRNTKFSQLVARAKLESCWTFITNCPDWFKDRDPTDEKIRTFIKYGVILRLPRLGSQGRTYLLIRPGSLDLARHKKELGGIEVMFRTMMTIMDWICLDERAQINGVELIVDQSNITLAHKTTIYSTETVKRFTTCFQKVYPMRLKKINVYNPPALMEAMLSIIKTFLKPKTRERFEVVGKNLANLYERIDMSVLPEEYLPDDYKGPNSGSIQSIMEYMLEELNKPEVVEYVKAISSNYDVNLDLKSEDEEPSASFRKLNVD